MKKNIILLSFITAVSIVVVMFSIGCQFISPTIGEITKETREENKELYQESDRTLDEFWDTYDSLVKSSGMGSKISDEYNKVIERQKITADEITGLTMNEKAKIERLSKRGLDIATEQQEILNRLRNNFYERSVIISELHGIVVKIIEPNKKALAQEIADKEREINNLQMELLNLYEKKVHLTEQYYKTGLFIAQGKMLVEKWNEQMEKREKEVRENSLMVDRICNKINVLRSELLDLIAKLINL